MSTVPVHKRISQLIGLLFGRTPGPQQVFQFRAEWFADGRSAPLVIKADRKWIEQYISPDEYSELFGGYATWRPPDKPTPMMRGEALGVWGRRNVSRFRRILRERGADFVVVNS